MRQCSYWYMLWGHLKRNIECCCPPCFLDVASPPAAVLIVAVAGWLLSFDFLFCRSLPYISFFFHLLAFFLLCWFFYVCARWSAMLRSLMMEKYPTNTTVLVILSLGSGVLASAVSPATYVNRSYLVPWYSIITKHQIDSLLDRPCLCPMVLESRRLTIISCVSAETTCRTNKTPYMAHTRWSSSVASIAVIHLQGAHPLAGGQASRNTLS